MNDSPSSTDPFDAGAYWQNRLTKKYALDGVGHKSFGEPFNQWMYRVRKRVFKSIVSSHNLSPNRILDIGSGTGFYIECWKDIGVLSVDGIDITDVAVTRLQERYPDCTFARADIGEPSIPESLKAESYDAISAMDVLFHITDDIRFQNALSNINELLVSGGYLIWSDNFIHGETRDQGHIKHRNLETSLDLLRSSGFEVLLRQPSFYFMNEPVDDPNWLNYFVWRQIRRITNRGPAFEYLTGAILYPLELFVISMMSESPTTEIMLCRKA